MPRIVWDERGKRLFETGVSHGVLYLLKADGSYDVGYAWNGLTAVNESPSGAEANPIYADNLRYANMFSEENYVATIEAYSYPGAFKRCLGKIEPAVGVTIEQQNRKHFGFSYQTRLGNDENGVDYQYVIHIVYNCFAGLSEASHSTINESPEPVSYSWEVNSEKVVLDGYKPTASLTLDRKKFVEEGILNVFRKLEDVLYGCATGTSRLPLPSEIASIVNVYRCLQDSDNNVILDSEGNGIQTVVFD